MLSFERKYGRVNLNVARSSKMRMGALKDLRPQQHENVLKKASGFEAGKNRHKVTFIEGGTGGIRTHDLRVSPSVAPEPDVLSWLPSPRLVGVCDLDYGPGLEPVLRAE